MFPATDLHAAPAAILPRPLRVPAPPAPQGWSFAPAGERLPAVVGAARDGAERIGRLSLVICGCGSIGGVLAETLARLGVARLLLVDPGYFKPQSLLTHAALPADVGRSKAQVVGERCAAISPRTQVQVFAGPLQSLRDADLIGADELVLATDNVLAEVVLGRRALHLGVPLSQASVDGATLCAQVRHWPNAPGGQGPCPACGFGAHEWSALDQGTRFSCEGGDESIERPSGGAQPTRSFAALCGLAAQLLALALVRRALSPHAQRQAELLEHAGLIDRTTVTGLRRNARCRVEHDVPARASLLAPLAGHSCAQLAELLGLECGEPWSLALDGRAFAARTHCGCTEASNPGPAFVPAQGAGDPCEQCALPREPQPFERRPAAPSRLLSTHMHRTLAELGGADARLARLEGVHHSLLLDDPPCRA